MPIFMKSCFVAALLLLLPGCQKENGQPAPQPPQASARRAEVAVPAFDSKSAFTYLVGQTDFGPRVPNSPAHEKCLAYLEAELRKYADAVTLQPFTAEGYDGSQLALTNVVASLNLQATTRILLIAHWDSRPRADQDPDTAKRSQA